ncbi:MAG: hypothetical protein KDI37_03010 [Xanthomonadales bacterium]|nr:hypothetical protein [Xanthomonadales bacterium]MCB1635901.1 hypothetical protein [Xanthomonadales bacterium]MCB1640674.1 hypothetical protein [Xanthomonadales bacterium]
MTTRILCAAMFAALLSGQVLAVADQSPTASDNRAVDRFVRDSADVASFLDELDLTMSRVKAGELGAMTIAELSALESAHRHIHTLLQNHTQIAELPDAERIAVYNAQQLMLAVIRRQPYEQEICRHTVPIGTRIASYECETWERRDERARNGRETTRRIQDNRKFCPGGVCP